MVARVELYRTPYCPYCVRAERLLKDKQVPFETIDVSGDSARRAWLLEQSGQHTVPQIFINQRSIGGYSELAALDRSGELDRLLAEAPSAS